MKKSIYILLALALFVLASAERSFACSCVASLEPEKKQVQQAFTDSTAIFSGEVLAISESRADKNSLLVKFKVTKLWKGGSKNEITITTNKESSMCGYRFEVGKKYLVYANGLKNELFVENCSRTTNISNNGDVRHLNKLKRYFGDGVSRRLIPLPTRWPIAEDGVLIIDLQIYSLAFFKFETG